LADAAGSLPKSEEYVMYVVSVDFVAKAEYVEVFRAEMLKNARASLADEPGCRQFDVSVVADDPAHIFLYELYDDRAAFDAHRRTPHFLAFEATTAAWLASKSVRHFQRICP
jgi:quinol monooxygenase YgiN